jgi:hypothetical protein
MVVKFENVADIDCVKLSLQIAFWDDFAAFVDVSQYKHYLNRHVHYCVMVEDGGRGQDNMGGVASLSRERLCVCLFYHVAHHRGLGLASLRLPRPLFPLRSPSFGII